MVIENMIIAFDEIYDLVYDDRYDSDCEFENDYSQTSKESQLYMKEFFIWILSNIDDIDKYTNIRKRECRKKNPIEKKKSSLKNTQVSIKNLDEIYIQSDLNQIKKDKINDIEMNSLFDHIRKVIFSRKKYFSIFKYISLEEFIDVIIENSILGIISKLKLFESFEIIFNEIQKRTKIELKHKDKQEYFIRLMQIIDRIGYENENFYIPEVVSCLFYLFRIEKNEEIANLCYILQEFDDIFIVDDDNIQKNERKSVNNKFNYTSLQGTEKKQASETMKYINMFTYKLFFNGIFSSIFSEYVTRDDINKLSDALIKELSEVYISDKDRDDCDTKHDYLYLMMNSLIEGL